MCESLPHAANTERIYHAKSAFLISIICTKISLTELVNGLVLLMLPIYFNALERMPVLGVTGYLRMRIFA